MKATKIGVEQSGGRGGGGRGGGRCRICDCGLDNSNNEAFCRDVSFERHARETYFLLTYLRCRSKPVARHRILPLIGERRA